MTSRLKSVTSRLKVESSGDEFKERGIFVPRFPLAQRTRRALRFTELRARIDHDRRGEAPRLRGFECNTPGAREQGPESAARASWRSSKNDREFSPRSSKGSKGHRVRHHGQAHGTKADPRGHLRRAACGKRVHVVRDAGA